VLVSTAAGSLMVPVNPLLLADTYDPNVPRSTPGSCVDSCATAIRRVHDDGHLELIIQPHELAPILTDFLLS